MIKDDSKKSQMHVKAIGEDLAVLIGEENVVARIIAGNFIAFSYEKDISLFKEWANKKSPCITEAAHWKGRTYFIWNGVLYSTEGEHSIRIKNPPPNTSFWVGDRPWSLNTIFTNIYDFKKHQACEYCLDLNIKNWKDTNTIIVKHSVDCLDSPF